jgi:hypothetical protein
LGYQKVKMLKGCFTPDNQFAETLQQGTEIMLLDTAAMRAKPIQAEVPKAEKKKAEAVIPVRQEVSSGGGC